MPPRAPFQPFGAPGRTLDAETVVRILFFGVVCSLLATATLAAEKPRVVASIEPLSMMARELLGDAATVETLLRPAQNLHSASMTPGQARAIRDAEIFVWLGAAAEPQLAPLVKRRTGTTLSMLAQPGVLTLGGGHEHGHDGHGEMTFDPHLWLAPDNIRALARALATAAGVDAAPFLTQLAETEAEVRAGLKAHARTPWLSHHDPWAYFYHAFPLPEPLSISEGSPRGASSKRMLELTRRMASPSVGCAIAEPEARRALLEKLCTGQCRIVAADPLGRDLAGAGYTAFLGELGTRFRRCLARAGASE